MSAWESERLDERTLRQRCGLSYGEVLRGWREDASFRASFTGVIAGAPFDGLFWETPAWTLEELDAPYEHVLKESAAVASLRADPSAFEARFGAAPIASFENLGGDALLVVPAPRSSDPSYAHLARFLREAPEAQRDALWPAVALAMMERLRARRGSACPGSTCGWTRARSTTRTRPIGRPLRALDQEGAQPVTVTSSMNAASRPVLTLPSLA